MFINDAMASRQAGKGEEANLGLSENCRKYFCWKTCATNAKFRAKDFMLGKFENKI